MAKKNQKQKEPAKPPPKIKYEDTVKFRALDRLMRGNKAILGLMQMARHPEVYKNKQWPKVRRVAIING